MKWMRANWRWVTTALLCLANILTWYVVARETRRGVLTVAFFDVGQGDAIYIESPTGNQVLVDGGPPGGPVLVELGKLMPFYDHDVDVVIGTHADADHIGGLASVLARYAVGTVLWPALLEKDTDVYKQFEQIVKDKAAITIRARRGQWLELGGGAILTLLWPDPYGPLTESNEESIVALLSYGKTNYLLTGDAPQWVERQLLTRGDLLPVDVLKAGHHGSKTSSATEFLSAVHPQYAIISSGKKNRYGHPHEETLSRLGAIGTKILRTDVSGTILIESDGERVW